MEKDVKHDLHVLSTSEEEESSGRASASAPSCPFYR